MGKIRGESDWEREKESERIREKEVIQEIKWQKVEKDRNKVIIKEREGEEILINNLLFCLWKKYFLSRSKERLLWEWGGYPFHIRWCPWHPPQAKDQYSSCSAINKMCKYNHLSSTTFFARIHFMNPHLQFSSCIREISTSYSVFSLGMLNNNSLNNK